MAQKIIWSYEAAEDLEAIAEYIGRDSAFYAIALVEEVLEAVRSLLAFSEMGRRVPSSGIK